MLREGRQVGLQAVTVATDAPAQCGELSIGVALTSLLQMIASPESLQQVVFWLFGSLQKSTWPKLGVLAVVLMLVLPVFAAQAWKLTALRLGDERARSLGIQASKRRV